MPGFNFDLHAVGAQGHQYLMERTLQVNFWFFLIIIAICCHPLSTMPPKNQLKYMGV